MLFCQQHKRFGNSGQQLIFLVILERLWKILPVFTNNMGKISPITLALMIMFETCLDRPTKTMSFALQQLPT
jgi:hypothetical protein